MIIPKIPCMKRSKSKKKKAKKVFRTECISVSKPNIFGSHETSQ